MQVRTEDEKEIAAFRAGEIVGEEFNDGEVWLDEHSLFRWRDRPANYEAETSEVEIGEPRE